MFDKPARMAAVAAATVVMASWSSTAGAQERVRWDMQSAFGSQLSHLGTGGVRLVETMETISGGAFQIRFYEPGALVPALECFSAASQGSVEACWTTAGYHTGQIPALAFFTAVPFGPQYGEFFAWKKFGGGDELKNEIYGEHDLYSLDCNSIGPETSGWFAEPVGALEDLEGLKMRFFGLGAQVMQKLGVSTQLLAGADIYPALERGVIDATEFSMPAMDIDLGFYQVADHNYFPGWHQQVSVNELLIHKPTWEALSEQNQALLRVACGEQIHYDYAETEWNNPRAMNRMVEEHGVTVQRWTDQQLAAFEEAWFEVLEEQSAEDPTFKRVADSYLEFREFYRIWGEAQALQPTYLTD